MWLVFLLNFIFLPPATAEPYRLGPGDTVKIHVFQEPDLSLQAKISAGGVIDFPLIGELFVPSLSPVQLKARAVMNTSRV
jgi:polysaccharide export outer membrane protein